MRKHNHGYSEKVYEIIWFGAINPNGYTSRFSDEVAVTEDYDYMSLHGFDRTDVEDLLRLSVDYRFLALPVNEYASFAPVHAWRILTQLGEVSAINTWSPLIKFAEKSPHIEKYLKTCFRSFNDEKVIEILLDQFENVELECQGYTFIVDVLAYYAAHKPDWTEKIFAGLENEMLEPVDGPSAQKEYIFEVLVRLKADGIFQTGLEMLKHNEFFESDLNCDYLSRAALNAVKTAEDAEESRAAGLCSLWFAAHKNGKGEEFRNWAFNSNEEFQKNPMKWIDQLSEILPDAKPEDFGLLP